MPAQSGGRLQPLLLHLRKVVMPLTILMLHVPHEQFPVGETGGQLLRRRNHSSTVVAHIDNQGVASEHITQDVIEVARPEIVGERAAVDISDIVVEHFIAQPVRYQVVGAEVMAL